MADHEAIFRFTTEHAGRIFRSLEPELADEVNPRSLVSCSLESGDELVIRVKAQDIASLRAALNMYLRLVSVADEMQEVSR